MVGAGDWWWAASRRSPAWSLHHTVHPGLTSHSWPSSSRSCPSTGTASAAGWAWGWGSTTWGAASTSTLPSQYVVRKHRDIYSGYILWIHTLDTQTSSERVNCCVSGSKIYRYPLSLEMLFCNTIVIIKEYKTYYLNINLV